VVLFSKHSFLFYKTFEKSRSVKFNIQPTLLSKNVNSILHTMILQNKHIWSLLIELDYVYGRIRDVLERKGVLLAILVIEKKVHLSNISLFFTRVKCEKVISTWTSPVVTHLSTTHAWAWLTLQSGRDAVDSD